MFSSRQLDLNYVKKLITTIKLFVVIHIYYPGTQEAERSRRRAFRAKPGQRRRTVSESKEVYLWGQEIVSLETCVSS